MDWNDVWANDQAQSLTIGPSTLSRLRLMQRLLTRYARPGSSLLDVGCGNGDLVVAAANTGMFSKLRGVDISDLPLQQARVACPIAEFSVADVCSESLGDEVDLVTCMMTLDAVPDDRAAAKNLAKVIKPGGHLLTVVQHLKTHRSSMDDHYGVRRHDRDSLTALLEPQGLVPIEFFSWGWPLFNFYYRVLDKRASQVVASNKAPSRMLRLASRGLVTAFRIDDLFSWTGRGRVLFGAFQRSVR